MNRRQIEALADLGFTTQRYFNDREIVWGLEITKNDDPILLIEQKPRNAGGADNFYYTFAPSQGKGALGRKAASSGRFKTQREAIAGFLSVYYSLKF